MSDLPTIAQLKLAVRDLLTGPKKRYFPLNPDGSSPETDFKLDRDEAEKICRITAPKDGINVAKIIEQQYYVCAVRLGLEGKYAHKRTILGALWSSTYCEIQKPARLELRKSLADDPRPEIKLGSLSLPIHTPLADDILLDEGPAGAVLDLYAFYVLGLVLGPVDGLRAASKFSKYRESTYNENSRDHYFDYERPPSAWHLTGGSGGMRCD